MNKYAWFYAYIYWWKETSKVYMYVYKKWRLRFSRKILLKHEGHLQILEQKMVEQRCLNWDVYKSFRCSEIALSWLVLATDKLTLNFTCEKCHIANSSYNTVLAKSYAVKFYSPFLRSSLVFMSLYEEKVFTFLQTIKQK